MLLLLGACSNECIIPPPHDYGDVYAEVDCTWVDPDAPGREAVWRCFEDLETVLLSGFIFLELENPYSLYLCGTDLILNSGVDVYDNLIGFLTENRYNCLYLPEDKNLGNSFDWVWREEKHLLQFIWRPEDEPHKMLSLLIEKAPFNEIVRSTVYYKILAAD